MNGDLRPVIVSLIPRGWTAEQALRAVGLLQQVIAAIWSVHGEAMSRVVLADEPPARPEPPRPDERRPAARR